MRSSTSGSDISRGRYLAKLAVFIGLVLGELVLADRLMDLAVQWPQELQYQALFDSRFPLRRIVIGSSTAAHGINPRYLDGPADGFFNMAFDSAGPEFYAKWYQLFRRYHDAPEVILFSVDWFYLNGRMARQLNVDSEYLPWSVFAESFFSSEEDRKPLLVNRFPLYKERLTFQQWLMHQGEWHKVLMDRYFRGFAPWWNPKPDPYPAHDQPTSPATRRAFEQLLRTLKRDGVRVIVVQTPQYLPSAREHPREDAVVGRICRAFGYPVLNYNGDRRSEINQNLRDFIDWAHLNAEGSTAFSRRLNADLKTLVPEMVGSRTVDRSSGPSRGR